MKKFCAALLAFCLMLVPMTWAEEIPEAVEEYTPLERIAQAMEVYSWFVMLPLDVDANCPCPENPELYRVLDERFDTMAELSEHARTYFSQAIVNELFDWGAYTEGSDGYLYSAGEGRGADPRISEVLCEISMETEERVEYEVIVCYLDDEQGAVEPDVFVFAQDLIGEKWLFTEFVFFW